MKPVTQLQIASEIRRLRAPESGLISAVQISAEHVFEIGRDDSGAVVVVLDQRTLSEKAIQLSSIHFTPNRLIIYSEPSKVTERRIADLLTFECENEDDIELVAALVAAFVNEASYRATEKYSDILIEIAERLQEVRNTARGSEVGFWGELFVMLASSDPAKLLGCWGTGSRQSFDFIDSEDALEVKTATGTVPVHSFSLSQLKNSEALRVVVASVRVIEDPQGVTIEDLVDRLSSDISLSSELRAKLLMRFSAFLAAEGRGNSFRRFSEKIARSDLEFINFMDFEHISAPENVLEATWSILRPDTRSRSAVLENHSFLAAMCNDG